MKSPQGTPRYRGHDNTGYDVPLSVTGVSFRTLDVAGRELVAQRAAQPGELAQKIVGEGVAHEAVVISTCNRFEVVAAGANAAELRAFLTGLFGAGALPAEAIYQHIDQDAVRHLYRVASSLDSMVVGEAQILGQVKQAYKDAVRRDSVGTHLHHLFQSGFHVAKRVRAHTDISQHGVSVSYVAVRLAQQIFSDLSDTSVLIIGSGEMAELSVLHLRAQGCTRITVANRTLERATDLAERFGGSAISLSDIDKVIDEVDIAIGSISIDKPILGRALLTTRKVERPLFLIDLGVPRNFTPDLAELDGVYLYNIDDLATIAQENKALREAAAQEADLVISHGLLQFERWRSRLSMKPELLDLRAKVQAICLEEVAQMMTDITSSNQGEVAARMAHSVSQKISHELTRLLERQSGIAVDEDGLYPFLIVSKREE
jgi:glutamyl-tRNA reductase